MCGYNLLHNRSQCFPRSLPENIGGAVSFAKERLLVAISHHCQKFWGLSLQHYRKKCDAPRPSSYRVISSKHEETNNPKMAFQLYKIWMFKKSTREVDLLCKICGRSTTHNAIDFLNYVTPREIFRRRKNERKTSNFRRQPVFFLVAVTFASC